MMINKLVCFLTIGLFLCSCGETDKTPAQQEKDKTPEASSEIFFRLVEPSQSGVTFSNNIQEDFKLNYYTYGYIYNGGGVAAGDIDNDGLVDLYFSSTMENNRLYRNKGNFIFEDITETAGVAVPKGLKTGVVMHDFNNDGLLDIFVSRSGNKRLKLRNNLLYINNGDLTFTESSEAYGLIDNSNTTHISLLDYDLDGDLDIYLVNHPAQFGTNNRPRVRPTQSGYERLTHPEAINESDRLFRNNGNNTYTDVTEESGIANRAFGLSAVVNDFNKDGYPDIFVGNDFIEPDFLYINNGDGTFKEEYEKYFRHISQNSMGADLADFNNDGYEDLVVLDMMPEDNERQKSLMTTMNYNRYNSLLNFGYGHQVMRNVLQMQNPDGSFSEIGQLAGIAHTDWSWGPLLVDFDLDGYKDLFIANGFRRDIADLDFIKFKNDSINKGGGIPVSEMESVYDILNKIPSKKVKNYMYQNLGDLQFQYVSDSWGLNQESFSNGAIHADLDNDGDPDLVINNLDSPAMIYENQRKNENNWLKIRPVGPEQNINGIGCRFKITANGVSQFYQQNPIRGFLSSTEAVVLCGVSDADKIASVEVFWSDGKYQMIKDVEVNQTIETRYSEAVSKNVKPEPRKTLFKEKTSILSEVFLHTEDDFIDYKRDPLLPRLHSREGPALCKGDINGDGLEDFFVGGAKDQTGVFYFQQNDGNFKMMISEALDKDKMYEDVDAVLFNANNDDLPDLYVVSGGSHEVGNHPLYTDRLYINMGNGKFKKSSDLPTVNSSGGCVSPADYDLDGDVDLFIGGRVLSGRYPLPPDSYLLENENGKFTDVTKEKANDLRQVGMVTDAEWADIDNDDQPELFLLGEWMPLKIFKYENQKFKDISNDHLPQKSSGWWNCLEIVDYDNDGDLDILAGNYGLNSRFKASDIRPIEIYGADFDKNGKIDPIITFFVGERSWPLAQKDLLISQIPSLKKRYVKYQAYAKASISDLFPQKDLNNALHLKCEQLSTTLFQNDGGVLKQIPFPIKSQIAPVQDILCVELNEDKANEIILIGNDFFPETETARLDAFNGAFISVSPEGKLNMLEEDLSGLFNPFDGRKMEILNRKTKSPVIIIVNNNAAVKVFEFNMESKWLP